MGLSLFPSPARKSDRKSETMIRKVSEQSVAVPPGSQRLYGVLGSMYSFTFHSGPRAGKMRKRPRCAEHGACNLHLVCEHLFLKRDGVFLAHLLTEQTATTNDDAQITMGVALCSEYPQRCDEHDHDHMLIFCAECVQEWMQREAGKGDQEARQ
jgi:hypothetical protein